MVLLWPCDKHTIHCVLANNTRLLPYCHECRRCITYRIFKIITTILFMCIKSSIITRFTILQINTLWSRNNYVPHNKDAEFKLLVQYRQFLLTCTSFCTSARERCVRRVINSVQKVTNMNVNSYHTNCLHAAMCVNLCTCIYIGTSINHTPNSGYLRIYNGRGSMYRPLFPIH